MGNTWTEDYGERMFMNIFDMDALGRDQCYLTIDNKDYDHLYLYQRYHDCVKCPYTFRERISKNVDTLLTLNTNFRKYYRFLTKQINVSEEDNDAHLIGPVSFGNDYSEFGVYRIAFANGTYEAKTLKQPVDIYFPLLTVFLIYAILFTLIPIGRFLWKYIKFERLDLPFVPKEKTRPVNNKRVQSLDTFRGISIVLMIFVNYGHGGYAFLEHAIWNGLYVGDLVFPWFIWIMGVCIPISVSSYFRREDAKQCDAIKNIIKRSGKLFLIGLFLGASPYLDKLRVFGVLQRFAICYLVVATINVLTRTRNKISITTPTDCEPSQIAQYFKDVIVLKVQWVLMLMILAVHCLITFCLKVPNCPTGYLGPGGLHESKKFENCTGGAAGYVDEVILGKHIYQYAAIANIYQTKSFDPEGILGCLTSIVHVFLGVQAGTIILTYQKHTDRIFRWLGWSILTGLLGGLLCGFSKEDGVIPLNKHLWSLSFVLVTSCFAFFLLTMCYIVIDMAKIWTGKPFLFAGMNAILMYVGHSMTPSNFPIHWYISAEHAANTHFMQLLENVWATSFWVVVSYYLYKIKFFWTL